MEFDKQKFMQSLKTKIPNANVKCLALTLYQKQSALSEIKKINSHWNHSPVLGSGALYK